MTSADVAEEILAGTPEAHARQEYECSFLAAVVGAYYTQELERVERDGRIRQLPWSPALEVVTAWNLGIADQTAIIFAQVHGPEVRIIDFYQHRGESLAHYAKVLSEKPYRYRDHFLPHDVENRLDDYGSGTTRREILLSLGVRPCRTVPRRPLEDAIPAVKHFFARCYFDRDKSRPLLKALAHYHADWKAERQVHGLRPVHDWSSDAADAFRYLALGLGLPPSSGSLGAPRPRVTVPPVQYSFTTPARRGIGPGPGSDRL
jgi:phage terminase large subunit